MKELPYRLLKLFLYIECLIFAFLYIAGTNGLQALKQLKRENRALSQDIKQVLQEVSTLQNEIADWHKYPYYKEKIAREQLQMMRKNEIIYLLES